MGNIQEHGSSSVISGVYTPSDTKFVTGQTSSNYSSGGYTGTLSLYVHSGSYTPADTKFVSGQTSSYYNSGGYTGSLSSYLYSGSYTPADSFVADVTFYDGWSTWDMEYTSKGWTNRGTTKSDMGNTYFYNSGGYSGTLTRYTEGVYDSTVPHYNDLPNPKIGDRYAYTRYWYYSLKGTVTRPASDTRVYRYQGNVTRPASDTRVYRYEGNVTRPASDTRIWQQDYSGTVYKGGSENLYSYTVTIAYNLKQ